MLLIFHLRMVAYQTGRAEESLGLKGVGMARTRLVTPVVINSIYARSGMLDGLKAEKNERKKKKKTKKKRQKNKRKGDDFTICDEYFMFHKSSLGLFHWLKSQMFSGHQKLNVCWKEGRDRPRMMEDSSD